MKGIGSAAANNFTGVGLANDITTTWITDGSNSANNNPGRFYAFSSELTAVPEPTAAHLLAVLTFGLFGLSSLFGRRGKRA